MSNGGIGNFFFPQETIKTPRTSDALKAVLFVVAVVMVIMICFGLYSVFRKNKSNQGTDIDQVLQETQIDTIPIGMPIIDPKLQKLDRVANFYLAKFKLNKMAQDQYTLDFDYDFNNLVRSFDLYTQDLILEEERRRQTGKRETAFDQIVDQLDGRGNGSTQDWEQDPLMMNISDETEQALGLNSETNLEKTRNAKANLKNIPKLDQESIDNFFNLIDQINFDLKLQNIMDFKIKNRRIITRLPLRLIGRNNNNDILLRFTPSELTFTQQFKNVTGKNIANLIESLDFWITSNYIFIYPTNNKEKLIKIPI
tara:strand:+ start:2041 stop:2973 length:933 start_codon:yes stop_codon:yes gene_type:complete